MDNKETDKREGPRLALLIFEGAMSIFYLLFSVVFLFPSLSPVPITTQFGGIRIALGIILGIYGIFRVYRVIRKLW